MITQFTPCGKESLLMYRSEALEIIRSHWRDFYPESADHKGIICPICGHGTHGDGIVIDKAAERKGLKYRLTCFGVGGSGDSGRAGHFHGDILDLIQEDKGMDFKEAFNYAADFLGLRDIEADPDYTKQERPSVKPAKQDPPTEPQAVKDYSAYYEKCSARIEEPEAVSYLQARHISMETAKRYHLGYDDAWISPTGHERFLTGQNKNDSYPSKRIIIPMSKNHYVARAISEAVSKRSQKMNETGYGETGCFNYDVVRTAQEPVFLLEGAFDALSVIEAGATAIALNSADMANKFLDKLKSETGVKASFVVCMDNDEKGVKAAKILKEGLEEQGYSVHLGNVAGNHKDANEALQVEADAFIKRVQEAKAQAAGGVKKSDMESFLYRIQTEAYKPQKTNIDFFDDLLGGGLMRQSLAFLIAPPNAGKTTLCQQIAEAIAASGRQVRYMCFEMSREQLLAKAISCKLRQAGKRYTANQILQGYAWTPKQKEDITAAISDYERDAYPYIRYNPDGTSADLDRLLGTLETIGKEYKAKGEPAPVVIIDYIHLITKKGMEVKDLMKQLVIGLKDYASKYDTIVIAISAANRPANKAGKMEMDSGRDSSNIEYSGDYVLGLETDPNIQGGSGQPRGMVISLNKSRLGEKGIESHILYDASYNYFYRQEGSRITSRTTATKKK